MSTTPIQITGNLTRDPDLHASPPRCLQKLDDLGLDSGATAAFLGRNAVRVFDLPSAAHATE